MPYTHHADDARLVIDLVDDPIVAEAHPVGIDSHEPLGSTGPGILSEPPKTFPDSLEQLRREPIEVALR